MIQNSHNIKLERIEPPFWWAGFKRSSLQLLIYGQNISEANIRIAYQGLQINAFNRVDNKDYLFVTLEFSPTLLPGMFDILFYNKEKELFRYSYELKERTSSYLQHKGFDPSDVIYLIMPDRYANSETIKKVPKQMEPVNRKEPNGRHGGDIKGIINHLDYITELGCTAIWLNPVLENNMPGFSYHGYAITDFYKIDARFGTNKDYKNLAIECHKRGIKLIKDIVLNHCGLEHWFIKNPPCEDWVHNHNNFKKTSNRLSTLSDPYASDFDINEMEKGWFDTTMPDLNQDNPYLAAYLLQCAIWWIEFAGLNGLRVDTFPYAEKNFMANWIKNIITEYPEINIVGEAWLNEESFASYWQGGQKNKDNFNSHLPGITDFPLCNGLIQGLMEKEGWEQGVNRIYQTLTKDFLYPNPYSNLIFLDNHDMDRIYSALDYNFNKWKIAVAILLTIRGIPQIYYGTEILMDGYEAHGHGEIRQDFPGGWSDDKLNIPLRIGLNKDQQNALNYLRNILIWRKNKEVIHFGRFIHFVPYKGVYVYFRIVEDDAVMVMVNTSNAKIIDTHRYSEILHKYNQARDIITWENVNNLSEFYMEGKSVKIFELTRKL